MPISIIFPDLSIACDLGSNVTKIVLPFHDFLEKNRRKKGLTFCLKYCMFHDFKNVGVKILHYVG